jgi:M6 family metalloprotease-like protein
MKKITLLHYPVITLLLFFLAIININAAPLKDIPMTVVQPNGDTLRCYASGDEFFNYLHDAAGFSIIQNDEGYYMYAKYDGYKIVPSTFVAGKVNPAQKGLQPHVLISNEQYQAQRAKWFDFEDIPRTRTSETNRGTINNLVVFIRFADQEEISKPFSWFNDMFNNLTPGYNSMINYFQTTSYGYLNLPSTFYPLPNENLVVSYKDEFPRGYYMPYNESNNPNGYDVDDFWERVDREHILLRKAVEYIAAMVPEDLDLDYDNDGYVDNICFVIKGGVTAWSTLLWPHRWSLFNEVAYIRGKQVWDYNFMLEGAPSYFRTSVLSHEMQHTLSYPDLYHYNSDYGDLSPVGNWDIMESNPNPPQQSGAFMKWKYGNWLDEPAIIQPGQYTLNSVGSGTNPVSYKILSPNPKQFFVVEFRKKGLFETVYGTGLLVYRINENYDGNAGYNGTDVFDEVYAFRPDGTSTNNGSINTAHFGVNDRIKFDCTTNPYPFLTDGTIVTNLSISDIIVTDENVTFSYSNIVGINENENDMKNFLFSIYPNPTKEYFEIMFSSELNSNGVIAKIYNAQGLLIKTIHLKNEKTSVDVSNLAKGFYIIKIGNEAKKLIIK